MNTFYVTTAIDYPNGKPHLGHLYEKIVADCYARWYRILGRDVFYLTGTDENGQKLSRSAEQAGIATHTYVEQNADAFRKLCDDLKLSHGDFVRTTEERHLRATHELWNKLKESDDIYFDRYQGQYCIHCEAFYTEAQAAEGNKCPEHGTPLESVEEDGYFFRMSRYQKWIIEHIRQHAEFIFPNSARKEILSRLEGDELKDLSISRPNQGWGIPVPSDSGHVIYTWFDALINYYTVPSQDPSKSRYWPANMHVIGKDITWFHSVIWPTMLHAAGIELPKQIYVHGMILAEDGRKMSKSLNNAVDPYRLIDQVSNDLIRYYMLRAISSGQDGAFSMKDLVQRHNSELANDLGNLVMRVVKLSAKRMGSAFTDQGLKTDFDLTDCLDGVMQSMERREHHRALDQVWELVGKVNAYLNVHEPWRIKDDEEKFRHHMINCIHVIAAIGKLLVAFLPETAEKITVLIEIQGEDSMGGRAAELGIAKFGSCHYQLNEPTALFPRLECDDHGVVQAAAGRA